MAAHTALFLHVGRRAYERKRYLREVEGFDWPLCLPTECQHVAGRVAVLRVAWSEGACGASQVEHQDGVVAAASCAVPGFEVTIIRKVEASPTMLQEAIGVVAPGSLLSRAAVLLFDQAVRRAAHRLLRHDRPPARRKAG